MAKRKDHLVILTRRVEHLQRRIETAGEDKNKLSYDRQEIAALKTAIDLLENELSRDDKIVLALVHGALASGASVDEAITLGLEAAEKLSNRLTTK